ncbi:acetyl-CoA C-acetyltransferase [Sinimarinibacterium sp. NLF-5-8]|uniref:acetyl-CoA C-acetyltransferase n=1 Tax=Sinimarinibacterium sp. NLF-5-8 TaxID=2698684 RepID=UPI00137B9993|nr:acetyl-CoA C-acetyltransferase [Sinimarinibacterium sp. NLF-5-8]QHS10301.1 acetyl-CoA C-acetyltransferase [Sinimarinibacterium sp. NLF-5-8]
MTNAYIYEHVRTPRGKGRAGGALHEISPLQLGTQVLQALRERTQLDTRQLDDVIMGVVSPVGEQGSVLPRSIVLNADYDESIPGVQVNRFCGSGLEAVNMAAMQVMSGQCQALVAGGVESMSRVPIGADGGAWSCDPAFAAKVSFVPQGISADLIATMDGFDRAAVDAFALESQRRAAQAWAENRFSKSVIPVHDVLGDTVLACDEYLRPATTPEDLARLKPAFEQMGRDGGFDAVAIRKYPQVQTIEHVHTAGNSSGIVDGACAVLLGNKGFGIANGLTPRARIRAVASVGCEPCMMLAGPTPAARKVLAKAGMSVKDIDLFEVNEAFAAVVLRFMRELEVDHAKVNVNGGAIALGHPLGATGAMLIGTALDELERTGQSTALCVLCVGAGMGTAAIIERV